jgi:hypothetical protein
VNQLNPAGAPARRFAWERAIRAADDVDGMTLAVALLVGTYANENGSSIRPAVYTLGEQLGFAVTEDKRCRPVSTHLARLVELGWLARTSRGAAGRPAAYCLTTPDRAPGSTVERAPESTVRPADRARVSTPPCSQQPGNRAPGSTPPEQDQITTTTSPAPEARSTPVDGLAELVAGELPIHLQPDRARLERCCARLAAEQWTPDELGTWLTRQRWPADGSPGLAVYRLDALTVDDRRRLPGSRSGRARAADARKCDHGQVDGMTVRGVGRDASRVCPSCEADSPAEDAQAVAS